MNPLLAAGLGALPEILDRILPNEKAKIEAQIELQKLAVTGELQAMTNQAEINKVEAASDDLFVAGWRPFVGWVCGFAFAYATIGHTILMWVSGVMGWGMPPTIDAEILSTTLWGLLGLGSLRTVEKIKGVSSGSK